MKERLVRSGGVYILAVLAATASIVSVTSAAPAPGASKHQQAIAKPVPVYKPPPVYVGAMGEYVRAAQGSYCYGICADYFSPVQFAARLPVVGQQRLTVDAGKRLKTLRGELVRIDGQDATYMGAVRAHPAGQGRFWKIRLPADVAGADALSLDLNYGAKGSSNVWAGLVG